MNGCSCFRYAPPSPFPSTKFSLHNFPLSATFSNPDRITACAGALRSIALTLSRSDALNANADLYVACTYDRSATNGLQYAP